MKSERPGGTWLLLALLALIWGSSFILMKRGLYHDELPVLTPWQMATARLAIAWLVLSPLLFRYAALFPRHWKPLLGTGLLGNGIPALLFATAQTRIPSALSGMLNSLTPLMTLLTGALFFATPVRMVHVLGIGIGLLGAMGLVLFGEADGVGGWSWYALFPVLGTLGYGFSGNIVKRHLHALPPMATAALALTWMGPMAIGLAIGSGLPEKLRADPNAWNALGHVAVLAVMSSAFALVLWNMLLQRTTAIRASMVTYLMPVVAIAWGLLDGESIGPAQLCLVALVLGAVWLVSAAERGR
ncbi:MAG: DMT family transporter [Flavobacteriales bacterium]|jgi:drug/metabolite transporter (DMT)-like permease|nr:DMT family transporter [Flavobacteriales bacterium]